MKPAAQARRWHRWACGFHCVLTILLGVILRKNRVDFSGGLRVRYTEERIAVGGWRTNQSACAAACATQTSRDAAGCSRLDRDEQWELVQGASNSDRVLFSHGIGWLLLGVQLVTIAAHYWAGWEVSEGAWQDRLRRNNNPDRWTEYALSAGLMTVAMASLTRVHSSYALAGFVMNNIGTQLCGHLAEAAAPAAPVPREQRQAWMPGPNEAANRAFLLGCLFFVATWVPLFSRFGQFFDAVTNYADDFVNILQGVTGVCARDQELAGRLNVTHDPDCDNPVDDLFSIPDILRLAVWVPFGLFCTFPLVAGSLRLQQRRRLAQAERALQDPSAKEKTEARLSEAEYFDWVERIYVCLSFSAKAALAGLVATGLLQEDPEFDLGCL